MKCKECNETEVIKINKATYVEFRCKKGHKWIENYKDKGGIHGRPRSYKLEIENILFPSEKILYERVLQEIGENEGFFTSSSAEDIMEYLANDCNLNRQDVYRLFRKITKFNNTNKN